MRGKTTSILSTILVSFFLIMVLTACQTTSAPFGQQRSAGSTEPPSNLLLWRSQASAEDQQKLKNIDLQQLFEQRQRQMDAQMAGLNTDPDAISAQPDRVDVSLLDSDSEGFFGQGDRAALDEEARFKHAAQARIEPAQQQDTISMQKSVKVGILLPLSGPHKQVGQALLNAAQLALVDVGIRNFELVIRDTKGTPEGAQAAANTAIRQGASLIIGPLFSAEVAAVKPVVRANNMNMIAFSTDWSQADQSTFLMGFMPFAQVTRVVNHAALQGYKNLGIIAPHNDYGNAVVETAGQVARRNNIRVTKVARYRGETDDYNRVVQDFTDYNQRMMETERQRAALEAIPAEKRSVRQQEDLRKLRKKRATGPLPFDMVLLAAGGDQAIEIGGLLAHYDVDFRKIKLMGTGLFDDEDLGREATLAGAWYAAPPTSLRAKFERDYRDIYGESPVRVASLAYDATALAAILAITGVRERGMPAFDQFSLTNSNGFSGIDGIFRFGTNGIVERGLAVLEVQRAERPVVAPAPETFMLSSN